MKSSGKRSALRLTAWLRRLGGHSVEGGELGIEDDALAAQDEDRAGDVLDRRQGLGAWPRR